MGDPATDRDPLEILAEEFMERRRQGESPSVEEYASSHPDLAEEIRELFPAIAAMERLKARSERSSDGLASLGPIRLERLGDFRIIREIGRGGMGIVFEAEQESLGRRVALKVLPRQALLEQRHLARFKRESQIASRLHHTNIVQVYGVGEQDGFHYYVMQYVRGVGLDKVIRRLQDLDGSDRDGAGEAEVAGTPDELLETVVARVTGNVAAGRRIVSCPEYHRFVAGIGEQAAEALAYAHEQGTLHRDVKPSNLLLDDQGTVWVTDFGLARAAHAPEVTQAGDLTGTLRYLAPERLSGRTDERGDIYSLGLTLYELLTLRPAYDETDRSALIHRVSQESPARPRAANPAIPGDLETIILKAISREPQHRYATAAEMGHDLRRFLEDRPVMARRIGPAGRLWRWCRRNRAVASLAASTLVLILAVAVVATVGYVRTRNALAREAGERRRAEAVAAVAGEALDRVFSRLGPSRVVLSNLTVGGTEGASIQVVGQPAISQETAALLEEMLPFYDRLAEQTGDDVGLQRRAAGARRRIGDIRQRLGQYDQAIAAYRRAIEMYGTLAREQPSDQTLTVSMAEAYNEVGKTCLLMRRAADAQQAHRHALDLLEATGATSPAAARFELARTHFFLGQRVPSEPGAKPPGPGHGPPPQEGPPDRPPSDVRPPPENRPPPPRSEPDSDPGREIRDQHLERAIALLTALNQEQPKNPDYRHLLALCYRELVAPPGQGRLNTAAKAIEILEGLVQDFPQIADYRLDLCETYAAVETMEPGLPQRVLPVMEERLRKAMTLSQQLTAQHPNVPEYLASQARIYHRLGEVFRTMHRLDDAEDSDRKALDIQTQLVRGFPEVFTYQVWEAAFRNSLADLLMLRDRLPETRALAETNIARTSRLLNGHPELWYLHALLMESNRTLAAALRRSGEAAKASKAESEAEMHRSMLGEGSRLPSAEPTGPRP
jgi:serine/threonine protein kinase